MHCSTTSRCTKSPVSPSSVISAQPADKWAVNRINSGHMYSPVFNYLAVNLAKEVRVTAQHSSSSLPLCFSAAPCSLLWRLYHTVPPHKHLVQQCVAPITFALGQDGEWPGLRGALTGLTGLCGALTGWEQHSQLHTDFMECTHTVGSALGLWESNYWPSDWCMLSSCASFNSSSTFYRETVCI